MRQPPAESAFALLALCACTVIGPTPAVSEKDFATIAPGMTREQVIARFGRPTWSFDVWQDNLTIMNYRYSDGACTTYQVSVRRDGTVRDAGKARDPACDMRR